MNVEIKPGVPLTDEQKKKLADENAKASTEAHNLAAEHRSRDERGAPLIQTIADSVKNKLENLPPEEPKQ